MKLTKSNIEYGGSVYPVVEIELTDEESFNHCGESSFKTFADTDLWDNISKDGEPDWNNDDDPRVIADNQIDYYLDNHTAARYCNGEISEGVMKVKVARTILSWESR